MLILKIYYHIVAIVKKVIYKIIYGKHIKFGKKVTFRKGFHLMIDKEAYVIIGDNCFFNNNCSINALSSIKIGNNCLFGENVKIYDHNHIFKQSNLPISEQGFRKEKMEIGNNCWIGSNVVLLKNAQVGNNSVIGAGIVLNEKVEDNSVLKIRCNYNVEKIRNE